MFQVSRSNPPNSPPVCATRWSYKFSSASRYWSASTSQQGKLVYEPLALLRNISHSELVFICYA